MKIKTVVLYIAFLVLLGLFSLVPRTEFILSLTLYSALFVLYGTIYYCFKKIKLRLSHILFIALIARIVMLFNAPLHSDDFFRFFWDGTLVLEGIDPYAHTPLELKEMGSVPAGLTSIFDNLNSPGYYSIYPITNQAVFALAAWIGGSSLNGFIFWLRAVLILFELISVAAIFYLLEKMGRDTCSALLYAINPLVLLEVVGNLHFEGMKLTFILLGFLALYKKRHALSGAWLGMAVSVKLTPLILFPFFLKYLRLKKFAVFGICAFAVIALLFLPIWFLGSWNNFMNSVQLYYGKFEFNASVYYLLRKLGYLIKGYNIIAELSLILSVATFILICMAAWKIKLAELADLILVAVLGYSIFFLLSMVVHPWYIIPLLGLSILSGLKYPILWTYLIYLSYNTYSQVPYEENYLLVFIQYAGVILLGILELRSRFVIQKPEIVPLSD